MNHPFRKKWGQNFLVDTNLLNKIANTINPEPDNCILEIGPGEGALSEKIFPVVDQMLGIEIDPLLIEKLKKHQLLKNLKIIKGDVLLFNIDELPISNPIRVIGNIPYNITSPIIFWLIEQLDYWDDAFLMVQKEVADRMVSKPNSKIYGRLSISIQARCRAEKLFDIKPNAFYPKPKVVSSVIKISPKAPLDKTTDAQLNQILILAFNQRRKKISNSLKEAFTSDEIKRLGIDPKSRPEDLTVDEYLRLSQEGINQ